MLKTILAAGLMAASAISVSAESIAFRSGGHGMKDQQRQTAQSGDIKSLKPESCNFGLNDFKDGLKILSPFTGCGMYFQGRVALGENPVAVVTHNGDVVAQASNIEISHPEPGMSDIDAVYIDFTPIDLPKGETYEFLLKEGSIVLENDATVSNEAVSIQFIVPEDLNGYIYLVKPKYDSLKRYVGITLTMSVDVVAIGEPQWELRRNDEVLGRYDAHIKNHDWNLSVCSADFPAVTFSPDADYTLVLAAGSFGAKNRPDITNSEISLVMHQADQSAIGEIEAEADSRPEFFDLRGRRLNAAPAHGPYIERRGSVTIKHI